MPSPWYIDLSCNYAMHVASSTEFDLTFAPRNFKTDDVLDPEDWEAIPFRFGPEPPFEIELFRLVRECKRAWVAKLAANIHVLQLRRDRNATRRRTATSDVSELPSVKKAQGR